MQTEKDVKSFGGLQGIRKKPSMYIGPPDSHGIWTCLREILDNGVDENLAGRNDSVLAIEGPDGYLWGLDKGGGIPTGSITIDVHGKKVKVSALTAIVRDTHTGAKFDETGKGAYDKSRGTHGVGIKATNALAEDFQIWTYRDGSWWTTQFKKGVEVKKVAKTTAPKLPHRLPTPKKGTVIRFKPDPTVFTKTAKFTPKHLIEWASITSYLNPGVKIEFVSAKGKAIGWEAKKGAAEYLDNRIAELKCGVLGKPFVLRHKDVDVALSFTDFDGIELAAYTNGLANPAGGVHADAVFKALSDAIKPYRKKKHKFTPADLKDGILGIVNYKISSPQFNNQVKEKLIDTRVGKPCYEIVLAAMTDFFKANKAMASRICDRAQELKGLKNEFTANKKVTRALSDAHKSKKSLLPGKFLSSPQAKPCDRELFLVEGESAKGCFVGTVPVALSDGTSITIQQLAEDFVKGVSHEGYSFNIETGETLKQTFVKPHRVKVVEELIEVELSDGSIILCTPDHPWLLSTGDYCDAELLQVGQELQTISRSVDL